MNCPISDLLEIKKGGNKYNQGTWIHPRIATYLASWIEEWKAHSILNQEKYMKEINDLEPYRKNQIEKQIQLKLEKKLNGQIEIETPIGFIDLITSDEIIEIKDFVNWKHAVGQIQTYSFFYPNKKKIIYLFGKDFSASELIENICATHQIEVRYEMIN